MEIVKKFSKLKVFKNEQDFLFFDSEQYKKSLINHFKVNECTQKRCAFHF